MNIHRNLSWFPIFVSTTLSSTITRYPIHNNEIHVAIDLESDDDSGRRVEILQPLSIHLSFTVFNFISPSLMTGISNISTYNSTMSFPVIFSFPNSSSQYRDPIVRQTPMVEGYNTPFSYFSMNRILDIAPEISSVGLLRNDENDWLIVNATTAEFQHTSNCLNNSVVNIPIRSFPRIGFIGFVELGQARSPAYHVTIETHLANNAILSLPRTIAFQLRDLLVLAGAVNIPSRRNERFPLFANCTLNTISSIPPLILHMNDIGSIQLFSDDYIFPQLGGDEQLCSLHVVESSTRSIKINPILIPGTNIHLTRSNLLICDSTLVEVSRPFASN
jgi:hypothetical protein